MRFCHFLVDLREKGFFVAGLFISSNNHRNGKEEKINLCGVYCLFAGYCSMFYLVFPAAI